MILIFIFFYFLIFNFNIRFFFRFEIDKICNFKTNNANIFSNSFVSITDLKIQDTRIFLLDELLENMLFNCLFVSFCILILINGSNFIDGLNTLNIGYYLLISLVIYYLKFQGFEIYLNNLCYFILFILSTIFIINIFNKMFLGDSGSYILGFIFSVILIETYNLNNNFSPFFIILLLWYPCFETLFSILRKNIIKKSPMSPDINHFHQLIFLFIKKIQI